MVRTAQVAESLVFGAEEVGAGATSDLRQATKLARHMVCDCGFSEAIGPMCVDEKASQATQQVADKEVRVRGCPVCGSTAAGALRWK